MADMLTIVSVQDVQDRTEFQLNTRFTDTFLETVVDDAVALVLDECPNVPARLASGALSASNYKRVVADVVKRVVRNPGGVASEGEGGYSYSTRSTVASGDFWLTDADKRRLNGAKPTSTLGTASIGVDYGWAR
jgi:hypothetical protein